MLAVLTLGGTSCADDAPALPAARIDLSTELIKAPALASTYQFDVKANCDWTITAEDGDADWAFLSERDATGAATVIVELAANTGAAARTVTYNIVNHTGTSKATIVIEQNAGSADGYMAAGEVKALANADGSAYTFTAAAKMNAIVVSSQRSGNYPDNRLAVITSAEAGNGLTVTTDEPMLLSVGDEVEIDLEGATLGVSPATGLLELKPVDDSKIARTENSTCSPRAIDVTVDKLAGGEYDGMLVSIECQVMFNDLSKASIAGFTTMQNRDGDQFDMGVLPASQLALLAVPTGSGTLTGIVATYAGRRCILPRSADDLILDGARYDGGITTPYVFSLMTAKAANTAGRYINFNSVAGNVNGSNAMTKDGTGVTMTVNLTNGPQATSTQLTWVYWHDASGHHNMQLGTFADGAENWAKIAFPLNEDLNDGFRLQFGWGAQKYGPKKHVVEYSNDDATWYSATPDNEVSFELPTNKPAGSQVNFFPFSFDVRNPACPLERRGTLYIRIRAYDKTGLNGGTISQTGSYARGVLHSCVIIDKIPAFKTTKPAGALWFQPFDNLTVGTDYLLGEKVCGLNNYFGDEISKWTAAQSQGMTGTNVVARPGYAQIGWSDNITIAGNKMTNNRGELCTPAVGYPGNYVIAFDAMAYKNKSVFGTADGVKAVDLSLDYGGDSRQAVIEVVGGGTIDGSTTKVIDNLSYDQFNSYQVTVTGATAATYVKFTSPTDAKFTRWFIDNITVKMP